MAPGATATATETTNPSHAGLASARVLPAPREFGNYSLRLQLAQGGMATVYLAQRAAIEGFNKWVAVKVVHPQFASDPRFVQMFLDEARLAARLEHPNICSVFDFGEADGTYYLAMEYLNGETLGTVIRRARRHGPLPIALAARIVADAARGLHHAHELKDSSGQSVEVVHRDVSPDNIFVLYDGMSKIVDFGIARSRDRLGERTEVGELKGKLAYMAPEQLSQTQIDRRCDVWALGVVLWEATIGQRLFRRDTDALTMMAVLNADVPLPSEVRADYPKALEQIVLRALARSAQERYQSADELSRALENYLATSGTPAGVPQLADFMRSVFADAMEARAELLRRETTRVPAAKRPATSDGRLSIGPPATSGVVVTSRRAKRAWWPALAAIGTLTLVATAWMLHARHDAPAPMSAPARAHEAPIVPASMAAHETPVIAAPLIAPIAPAAPPIAPSEPAPIAPVASATGDTTPNAAPIPSGHNHRREHGHGHADAPHAGSSGPLMTDYE